MLFKIVHSVRLSALFMPILLLFYGCGTPVKEVSITTTDYEEVAYQGQVPEQVFKDVQKRYPPGFWQESGSVIPPDQQLRVSIRRFDSSPDQPDLAKIVTDVFVTSFVRSRAFNVVEREQLDRLATELELNQSGMVEQVNAPETGQLTATDVIITGAVNQMGNTINLEARVLDVASGRIVLAESISPAAIDTRSASMLARMIITKMKEQYYGNSLPNSTRLDR